MKIQLLCPPMKIISVNRNLKRTAEEPMRAIIGEPGDALKSVVENVIIPETDVHKVSIGPLRWRVDACVGKDKDGIVVCELPPEDVLFSLEESVRYRSIIVIAVEIRAKTTVTLHGQTFFGYVTFPDCMVDILHGGAQAVTAVGEVF